MYRPGGECGDCATTRLQAERAAVDNAPTAITLTIGRTAQVMRRNECPTALGAGWQVVRVSDPSVVTVTRGSDFHGQARDYSVFVVEALAPGTATVELAGDGSVPLTVCLRELLVTVTDG
eukprot:gnl/Spiro4/23922_TR11844_c0_g1_i1.p1 gnl/Spiro4/23922_TR11844_c0_g1~~gnl/Spiro4/23922_TR11844_c0_g1_i1.p1  ORF type:complete len:120 (-),score=20.89 gnl/Spiro4/23922_TR11844_c0_g1_i1:55-414(-)